MWSCVLLHLMLELILAFWKFSHLRIRLIFYIMKGSFWVIFLCCTLLLIHPSVHWLSATLSRPFKEIIVWSNIIIFFDITAKWKKKVNAIIFSLENAVPSNWSQCIRFVYFLSEDFEICRFHAALNNRALKSKLLYQTEFPFSVHLIFNYGQRLLISCRLKAGG